MPRAVRQAVWPHAATLTEGLSLSFAWVAAQHYGTPFEVGQTPTQKVGIFYDAYHSHNIRAVL